jgi:hypothetical protein
LLAIVGEQPPAGKRQRPTAVPWLAALFLGGAALGVWFLIGPALAATPYYRVGYNRTAYEYNWAVLALFVPYALALLAWSRGARAPMWALLGGAFVLHLLVLFSPPPQSQDFYQYLFYGRMHAIHGANPFVISPRALWADPWFPWIRWNAQLSVYGPAWILASSAVVKVAGGSLASAYVAMKLVILTLDAAIVGLILALARERRDPAGAAGWGLLAYAWNPLILITVPLAGSADVAVGAAFLGALLARRRGRDGWTTLLLSLASLVKIYAIIGLLLHLVLLARERGWRRAIGHGAASAAVAAAVYAPFWKGFQTFRGLVGAADLTSLSLAGFVRRNIISPVLRAFGYQTANHAGEVLIRVIGAALLLAAVVWVVRKVKDEGTLWPAIVAVLLAYALLTPWFLYWYIVGPLVLVAALPPNRLTVPLLVFSATSLITAWFEPISVAWWVQTTLRYGPPILAYFLWPARVAEPVVHHLGGPAIHSPLPLTAAAPQRVPAAK